MVFIYFFYILIEFELTQQSTKPCITRKTNSLGVMILRYINIELYLHVLRVHNCRIFNDLENRNIIDHLFMIYIIPQNTI